MRDIWKYPIGGTPGRIAVEMPAGSRILSVGLDVTGAPCFWALVDRNAPVITREVVLMYTGETSLNDDFCEDATFIGTVAWGGSIYHLWDHG